MAFSGALTLTDLNDYLGPSQACIKPVEGKDAPDQEQTDDGSTAATQIAVESSGVYESHASTSQSQQQQPRARTKLEAAEISLNDCLACSGCVTSAESVLIGMQSVDEIRRVLNENQSLETKKHLVASIAPQTLASLSARYSSTSFIPLSTILTRVSHFLHNHLTFEAVFDTTFARHVALREHQREFFDRRNTKMHLPMLASACPGWICYAEKTHGELLPFISTTKSPQQVAGTIVKRWYAAQKGIASANDVYHVTVMPCYDKKLEASRPDFFDDVLQTKDVDCVITTGELDKLMQEEGFDVRMPVEGEEGDGGVLAGGSHVPALLPSLLDQPGSSSGGYLFSLMEATWQEWLLSDAGRDYIFSDAQPRIDIKTIRTSDFTEYILRAPTADSPVLFKGAHCYGFRNLQNLVRKVQRQTGVKSRKGAAASSVNGEAVGSRRVGLRGRARGRGGGMVRRGAGAGVGADSTSVAPVDEETGYDYVEVMACPGGCVNGGGQIRPPSVEKATSGISMAISSGLQEQTEAQIDAPTSRLTLGGDNMDAEGYPSISTPTTATGTGTNTPLTDPEPDMTQGWQGTSKEWVKRVEEAYWAGPQRSTSLVDLLRSRPTAVHSMHSSVDRLAEEILSSIGSRDAFLRTAYRAVQDEAVNGLAVQW